MPFRLTFTLPNLEYALRMLELKEGKKPNFQSLRTKAADFIIERDYKTTHKKEDEEIFTEDKVAFNSFLDSLWGIEDLYTNETGGGIATKNDVEELVSFLKNCHYFKPLSR